MKIHKSDKKDKNITSQLSDSWRKVDYEHFGRKIDKWDEKEFFLYIGDKEKPIGYVFFKIEMGVGYIHELIVADEYRRKGIGQRLMEEAEKTAKEEGAHLMYLTTGKDWKERKFYEAIGYNKSADLKNHYLGIDFIHLTKEL